MTDDAKQVPFDLYTDAFTVSITPFGANLSFSIREAHPNPNVAPQIQQLGTFRMSVEHLKTLVWLCRKQIRSVEGQMGVSAQVPTAILNQLGVPQQDWNDFWQPITNI